MKIMLFFIKKKYFHPFFKVKRTFFPLKKLTLKYEKNIEKKIKNIY